MRRSQWSAVVCTIVIVGCASSGAVATNVSVPLGAHRTTAANLPPATYWPAQAELGERVFNQTCAMCHARAQFVGESFVDTWNDRRVFDFYALVRSTMPLTNPGGLKETEYLALVSYLLKANHADAGTDSLRSD